MFKKLLLFLSLILLGTGCAPVSIGDVCNSESDQFRTAADDFSCLVQYRQAYDNLVLEVDYSLTVVESQLNIDIGYFLGQPVNPN